MKVSKAASRYAKALLELASEQKAEEQILADMDLIANTIHDSDELLMAMKSKVINEDKKERALDAIFKGRVHDLTFKFFVLLTKNSRADLIQDITVEYKRVFKEAKGILEVVVKSAHKLDAAALDKIKSMVLTSDWKSVEIVEEIDENLIGGFVVKSNNTIYDASVASQLRDLKMNLLDYSHVSQL
jgi:F-type H+-transporting ATPase subunit delta